MRLFIPLDDELLYEQPEMIDAPCVPYQVGMVCDAWLVGRSAVDTQQPGDGEPLDDKGHATSD